MPISSGGTDVATVTAVPTGQRTSTPHRPRIHSPAVRRMLPTGPAITIPKTTRTAIGCSARPVPGRPSRQPRGTPSSSSTGDAAARLNANRSWPSARRPAPGPGSVRSSCSSAAHSRACSARTSAGQRRAASRSNPSATRSTALTPHSPT
ncbi:hypothetical protein [Dactylosporangium cerinum]